MKNLHVFQCVGNGRASHRAFLAAAGLAQKILAKGSSIDRSFMLTVFNKLRSSGCS
jgi:hypothetical protein